MKRQRSKNKRISASEKEFNKLVKNVQSKVNRIKKNFDIDLSKQMSFPSFENMTTKERGEAKAKMRSFTNRSNTNYQFVETAPGVVVTKKELNQAKRNAELATKKNIQLAKKIDPKFKEETKGMSQKKIIENFKDYHISGLGYNLVSEFNPKNYSLTDSLKRRMKYLDKIATRNFDEDLNTMKGNYINKLSEVFNSDADDLIEKLKGVDHDTFYTMFNKIDLDFDDFYQMEVGESDKPLELEKLERRIESYLAKKSKSLSKL